MVQGLFHRKPPRLLHGELGCARQRELVFLEEQLRYTADHRDEDKEWMIAASKSGGVIYNAGPMTSS